MIVISILVSEGWIGVYGQSVAVRLRDLIALL